MHETSGASVHGSCQGTSFRALSIKTPVLWGIAIRSAKEHRVMLLDEIPVFQRGTPEASRMIGRRSSNL